MEFIGQLKAKVDDREGDSQNGHWRVASFLLETVEMYPKKMVVDVRDGNLRRIEEFEALIGKNVRVEFEINANEYNGRWYNKITAYRIFDRAEEQARAAAAQQGTGASPMPADGGTGSAPAATQPTTGDGEDLPF